MRIFIRLSSLMKHLLIFLVTLVVSGVMVFGHLPRWFTGAFDTKLGRVPELISFESTDSNVVEVDGIELETVVFDETWPIPAKLDGANTRVQFGVRITNNTPESIRVPWILSFSPTIVKLDGQALQMAEIISSDLPTIKEPICQSIKPGKSKTFVWNWILQWHNNQLQLEGTNAYGAPWTYQSLTPGVYSIGSEYNVRTTIVRLCELMTKVPRTEEKIWVGQGTTPSKTVSLVQL